MTVNCNLADTCRFITSCQLTSTPRTGGALQWSLWRCAPWLVTTPEMSIIASQWLNEAATGRRLTAWWHHSPLHATRLRGVCYGNRTVNKHGGTFLESIGENCLHRQKWSMVRKHQRREQTRLPFCNRFIHLQAILTDLLTDEHYFVRPSKQCQAPSHVRMAGQKWCVYFRTLLTR